MFITPKRRASNAPPKTFEMPKFAYHIDPSAERIPKNVVFRKYKTWLRYFLEKLNQKDLTKSTSQTTLKNERTILAQVKCILQ